MSWNPDRTVAPKRERIRETQVNCEGRRDEPDRWTLVHQLGRAEHEQSGNHYKEIRALVETASEMFDETGCVPGIDGEEVRAETIVPDAKEYTSESIDNPEVLCDSETWDRPGFTLVISWLAQKWLQKCHKACTSQ